LLLLSFLYAFQSYAQSNVQSAFDDTDTIGLISFAGALIIFHRSQAVTMPEMPAR
jgi:hypothetical protein